jgi:hypothetical protein
MCEIDVLIWLFRQIAYREQLRLVELRKIRRILTSDKKIVK